VRLSRRSIFAFFAVLGPGFITASAGNDVAESRTYSAAGAKFGYATLWTLVALTVSLIVVQEMAGRMGAVTGQGLAGLIRENFGLRTTFFTMVALFFVNTGIAATEFAGIAAASEIFRVSHYITVPLATVVVFSARPAASEPNRRANLRHLFADLSQLRRLRACARIPTGAKSHGAPSCRKSCTIPPSWSPWWV